MTTLSQGALYEAQHMSEMQGKKWAVYNPNNLALEKLPVIYGWNNGGSGFFLSARLIAEDGTILGGHACSSEAYMEHDLGILEGSRPDRHEEFKAHYPDGYRMEFVSYSDAKDHEGLKKACELYSLKSCR